MKRLLLLALVGSLAFAQKEESERLEAAADVFQEIMGVSDKAIPQELLDKSECAIVVPGLKKAAFVFGGKFGRGYFVCRKAGGGWGSPASIRMEGGSFGFQIGGSEMDVVLLVMNKKGADRLLSNQFKLGGEASAAAGPVGRTSTASTDAYMTAEMLSYSRSRGVFAGISLEGSTVRQDLDANRRLYGKTLTNKEIIETNPAGPAAAKKLVGVLNKYSARKSN
ncbi:MAG: lipid-binding SYLF domain-containing protein [Bryobacter sp.]|nr:lipid-binding SYLF domain-containing protein [Bryobacter sp.]